MKKCCIGCKNNKNISEFPNTLETFYHDKCKSCVHESLKEILSINMPPMPKWLEELHEPNDALKEMSEIMDSDSFVNIYESSDLFKGAEEDPRFIDISKSLKDNRPIIKTLKKIRDKIKDK